MRGPDEGPEFEALLDRVRAGDEAALEDLIRCYEARLRTEARLLLGPLLRPYVDTVDLVQTVHRALLPGLREGSFRFTDPPQLVALALRILRRKLSRKWRQSRGRPDRVSLEVAPEGAADDGSEDPAQAALVRDERARVLGLLLPGERKLVELLWQGWSPAEIAAELGQDAHYLRSRLAKLRLKLKSLDVHLPE